MDKTLALILAAMLSVFGMALVADHYSNKTSVVCIEGYKYVVTANGGIIMLGPTPAQCKP